MSENDVKDVMMDYVTHCMGYTDMIERVADFLFEEGSKGDDVPYWDNSKTDDENITIINDAVSKAVPKTKHFKVMWEALKDASIWYDHDYNEQLISILNSQYELEVSA